MLRYEPNLLRLYFLLASGDAANPYPLDEEHAFMKMCVAEQEDLNAIKSAMHDIVDILHARLSLNCGKFFKPKMQLKNNGSQRLGRSIDSAMHLVLYKRSIRRRQDCMYGFERDLSGNFNGIGGKRYNPPLKHRLRNVYTWCRLQSISWILMV